MDAYLDAVSEPQRSTLRALREVIRAELPNAEETISYGVPTFKEDGKGVAGFAAYKNHCSYLPMSGSVLNAFISDPRFADFEMSKGALKFPIDQPLDGTLVHALVQKRLAELG